jgi:hypothetical protein
MKNLLILCLVIFGVTSCSKDSLDIQPDVQSGPELSEILVSVNYLEWTADQCAPGCVLPEEAVAIIQGANILLYEGQSGTSGVVGSPMIIARTDDAGKVLLEDLSPGQYTITVDTPIGQKSRTVTTQLHRRSFIDFSF